MSNSKTAADTGGGGHSDAALPKPGGEVVKRHYQLITGEDAHV